MTYAKGLGYPEEFRSDFDILIILKSRKFLNEFYNKLNAFEDMLNQRYVKYQLTTPVSLFFYGLDEVCDWRAKEANPFFKDVTEQGISLYNSGRYEISKAQKIDTGQKRELAQRYFDNWFNKARIDLTPFWCTVSMLRNTFGAQKPSMKYEVIKANRSKYPVEKICKILQVSRSGFKKWEKRQVKLSSNKRSWVNIT